MAELLESPLVDAATVARLFLVDPSTVHRWVKSGKLPAIRLGRAPRFRRADIDRILQGDDCSAAQPQASAQS
jgi:excisionase family DNA binding protein